MPIKGSIVHPGRWDSELNPIPCDRYNNAELTIFLRGFLQQANPAGGAAQGTAREWGTDGGGVRPGPWDRPENRPLERGCLESMARALRAGNSELLGRQILVSCYPCLLRIGLYRQECHLPPEYLVPV